MPQNLTGSNSEIKLSVLITGGSGLIGRLLNPVFSEKLMNTGFKFLYANLEDALDNIINGYCLLI